MYLDRTNQIIISESTPKSSRLSWNDCAWSCSSLSWAVGSSCAQRQCVNSPARYPTSRQSDTDVCMRQAAYQPVHAGTVRCSRASAQLCVHVVGLSFTATCLTVQADCEASANATIQRGKLSVAQRVPPATAAEGVCCSPQTNMIEQTAITRGSRDPDVALTDATRDCARPGC
jgi:hypothetical protein